MEPRPVRLEVRGPDNSPKLEFEQEHWPVQGLDTGFTRNR